MRVRGRLVAAAGLVVALLWMLSRPESRGGSVAPIDRTETSSRTEDLVEAPRLAGAASAEAAAPDGPLAPVRNDEESQEVFRGRVLDEADDPVPDARVTAFQLAKVTFSSGWESDVEFSSGQ